MKKKIIEFIKNIGYRFEDKLKDLCGEITPDKRLTVILIMLLLFAASNLYLTYTTIHNWGREYERKKQMKIEHINSPELKNRKLNEFIDSDIEYELPDSIGVIEHKNLGITGEVQNSINKQIRMIYEFTKQFG